MFLKDSADIFDVKEQNFKKMLKQRTDEGQSTALVKATKKGGRSFNCEITSAVFTDAAGVEKAITTIVDQTNPDLKLQPLPQLPEIEITGNNKRLLIAKIKNVIIASIYNTEEKLKINYSDYLRKQLQYDYTYLANIFSEEEATTIQQFIISTKIEYAKDLIKKNKSSLTKIALQLHYSSVAHLSNQFKKVAGLTPSAYKRLHLLPDV